MLVRVVALALIGWAVAELALYCAICRHNDQPIEVVKLILKAIPSLVGVVMLIKAKALAEWVSDWMDN